MNAADDTVSFATLEQAAEWYAVFRSGKVKDEERQRWEHWLAADAGHRAAWARVEAISEGVAVAKAAPDAASSALHAASQLRKRRKLLKTLALAALTSGLGWQLARQDEVRATLAGIGASYRTGVGESRQVVLADGSRLWLNTGTAMDVRFDDVQRLLVLHHGEILIDTQPDSRHPARPLIVRSRHGSMRALGTRFDVRQFAEHTQLGVSHGRVEVTPLGARSSSRVIDAGQEVRFSSSGIAPASGLPVTREAWTQGMLIVQDQPLQQFLAELSRYRHGYLGCDPSIAGLRVVGAFPLRDTDQALAMLEAALPVQARSVMPWWVTLKAKK